MVLPYLKGLINKVNHFYLYSDLVISWVYWHYLIFSYQIYNKWYQSTFLGTKVENFFIFLQGFLGGEFADQICMFW